MVFVERLINESIFYLSKYKEEYPEEKLEDGQIMNKVNH